MKRKPGRPRDLSKIDPTQAGRARKERMLKRDSKQHRKSNLKGAYYRDPAYAFSLILRKPAKNEASVVLHYEVLQQEQWVPVTFTQKVYGIIEIRWPAAAGKGWKWTPPESKALLAIHRRHTPQVSERRCVISELSTGLSVLVIEDYEKYGWCGYKKLFALLCSEALRDRLLRLPAALIRKQEKRRLSQDTTLCQPPSTP